MTNRNERLFYLGFAFPPGVSLLYPGLNPAGHMLETSLVHGLREYFDVRSAGLLPIVPPQIEAPDSTSGVAHEILLRESWPELLYRKLALANLQKSYLRWLARGWKPDWVLVYNLSPVYNQFLRWLRRRGAVPKLALLLLDSPNLGESLSWLKRARRAFKPMYVADSAMLPLFDAGIGLSRTSERHFAPRQVPFLWMPGGVAPERARRDPVEPLPVTKATHPMRFGYYGALGAHAGARRLAETFLRGNFDATLEICGYGKAAEELARLAQSEARLKFHGLRTPDECLEFGRQCDVLVNPRPATHGNENNFASKVFDYAMAGRAILTSRISGVDAVLGPQAYYFNPVNFEASLAEQLELLTRTSRDELNARGRAIQEKVMKEYSWAEQTRRIANFLQALTAKNCKDSKG